MAPKQEKPKAGLFGFFPGFQRGKTFKKADTGEKLALVYVEGLGWVEPGKEDEARANLAPPPPPKKTSVKPADGASGAPRNGVASRYAAVPGIGGAATAQSSGITLAASPAARTSQSAKIRTFTPSPAPDNGTAPAPAQPKLFVPAPVASQGATDDTPPVHTEPVPAVNGHSTPGLGQGPASHLNGAAVHGDSGLPRDDGAAGTAPALDVYGGPLPTQDPLGDAGDAPGHVTGATQAAVQPGAGVQSAALDAQHVEASALDRVETASFQPGTPSGGPADGNEAHDGGGSGEDGHGAVTVGEEEGAPSSFPEAELPAFTNVYNYEEWSEEYWKALYHAHASLFYYHWMSARQLEGWTEQQWQEYQENEPEHYAYMMYFYSEWADMGLFGEPAGVDEGVAEADLLADGDVTARGGGAAAVDGDAEGDGVHGIGPGESTGPGAAGDDAGSVAEGADTAGQAPARGASEGGAASAPSSARAVRATRDEGGAATEEAEAGAAGDGDAVAAGHPSAGQWADPDADVDQTYGDMLLTKYRDLYFETEGPASSSLGLQQLEQPSGGAEPEDGEVTSAPAPGAPAHLGASDGRTDDGGDVDAAAGARETERALAYMEKALPVGAPRERRRRSVDSAGSAVSQERDAALSAHMSDAQSEAASSVLVQPPSLHAPSEVLGEGDEGGAGGGALAGGIAGLLTAERPSLLSMVIPEQAHGPMDVPVTDDAPKLPPMFGEVPHATRPEISITDLERTGIRIGEHSMSCVAEAASMSGVSDKGSVGQDERVSNRSAGAANGGRAPAGGALAAADRDADGRASRRDGGASTSAARRGERDGGRARGGADPAATMRALAPRMADLQGALSRAVAGGVFDDLDLAQRFQELQERNGFLLDELQARKLAVQYDVVETATPQPSHPATPLKDDWNSRLRTPGLSDMSTPKPNSHPSSGGDDAGAQSSMTTAAMPAMSNPLFAGGTPQTVVADIAADLETFRLEIATLQSENAHLASQHGAALADLAQSQADVQSAAAEVAACRAELQERDMRIDALAAQIVSLQSQAEVHGSGDVASSSAAAAAQQLVETQQRLAEQEEEFSDLLACLGLESERVRALSEKLKLFDFDVDALLEAVEQEHGWGDDEDVGSESDAN